MLNWGLDDPEADHIPMCHHAFLVMTLMLSPKMRNFELERSRKDRQKRKITDRQKRTIIDRDNLTS